MPYSSHGGSNLYISLNTAGNTNVNDYCMSLGVMAEDTSVWYQSANGYDSPNSDPD